MTDQDLYLSERRSLLSSLLDAVKQCQIRFGGRTELATDSDSRVSCLCNRLEAVLNHGIKFNNKGLAAIRQVTEKVIGLNLRNSFDSNPVFWHFIKEFLNRHEYDRYMMLRNISSDSGRGRAWLRSALNERSLEKYMHMVLADPTFIAQYYEDWSFLLDQERSSMLPMMSAGLGSILFAINIDETNLNSPSRSENSSVNLSPSESVSMPSPEEPVPVITAKNVTQDSKRKDKRRKKKGQDKIVSFDEDDGQQTPDEVEIGSVDSQSMVALEGSTLQLPHHTRNLSKDSSQDGAISDLSGEVSNASSTSEESSRSSAERIVPTSLPCNSFSKGITREMSSLSISTQSSTDTAVSHSADTTKTTLTPVTDTSVELILVSDDDQQSQSDSVSIPSFNEDTDHAAQALALTQKAVLSSSRRSDANGLINQDNGAYQSDLLGKISGSDLNQVIYSLLQKQEEGDEQNRSLRHLLDQEMEISSSLRLKIEQLNASNDEKLDKEKKQIQALSRENDVLKHQLKKYVGAVQMLKRDTVQAHEVLQSNSSESINQSMMPVKSHLIDHESEAMQYEQKLIQVAEMHGELMEFNERLHRSVIIKDNTIKRLKNELVDLRGPLPDAGHLSDDDLLSESSDYDTSSVSTISRVLINIWIPSAFLTGKTSDTHHVYQVFVRIKDIEWNIYRRYSHFNMLHQALKKKHKIVNTFNFPPKKALGNKDAKLVEDRRHKLQHYLRCVINFIVQNNTELFTNPDKETLIKLMPFFGDVPTETKKSKQKSSTFSGPSSSIQSDPNVYSGL